MCPVVEQLLGDGEAGLLKMHHELLNPVLITDGDTMKGKELHQVPEPSGWNHGAGSMSFSIHHDLDPRRRPVYGDSRHGRSP